MSDRMRKIDSAMQEMVAQHVAQLKDPRIGFVTVTYVKTSPNLHHAVVYYSVLGTEEEAARTAEGLESAAPRISRAVGSESSMKFTPTIRFEVDKAAERSAALTDIFRKLEEEREEFGVPVFEEEDELG
jgi:ribosome-binding factor A